ncbi:MAG: surface protein [Flavipsychrobacter sp.]|jgi:uncharacterized protein YjdB|nr:surface protein [Flavipsychrobacter sp.]
MKKLYLLLFFISLGFYTRAQHNTNQNKVWAFGFHGGLNFNSGSPVSFYSGINQSEGAASICNAAGALLFYTDGKTVWNSSHSVMPNGSSIVPFSTTSSSQAAVIVPVIGNPNQYYIFSQEVCCGGQLAYTIVDMTLNGGTGDVVTASMGTILCPSGMSEKVTAVTGTSCDVWLLTHRKDSAVYWAYNISTAGINPTPVISHVGSFTGSGCYAYSGMRISPNRRKIANLSFYKGIELNDFDPATGQVYNNQVLSTATDHYGAEFSPDNSKLYVCGIASNMYQYNLSLSTTAAIAGSRTTVASGAFTEPKLAPDNKIYFGTYNTVTVNCFSSPNSAGFACAFTPAVTTLPTGAKNIYCLTNAIVGIFPTDTSYSRHDTIACLPTGASITIKAHDSLTGSGYIWDDGIATTSTRVISGPGTYWVKIYNGCGLKIDTIHAHAYTTIGPILGSPNICIGSATTLTDTSAGGIWSSRNPAVATIGSSSGIVTPLSTGTDTIRYTIPSTNCYVAVVITVSPLPVAITGAANVCAGATDALSCSTAGGVWSSSSLGVATMDSVTGTLSGIAAGAATITYNLPTGCKRTHAITIDPLPAAITGTGVVCAGSSTTLATAATGGMWISGNALIADIGSSSGIVTGMMGGTAAISYQLPTGCFAERYVTINALPTISGPDNNCFDDTTGFYGLPPGGAWASSAPAIVWAGSSSGLYSGVTVGSATITYTLATGCFRTIPVTVNAIPPPISGSSLVCFGFTSVLTNSATGGRWSSSSRGIADVDPLTGAVTGMSLGTAVISYALLTGCAATRMVTVNPPPFPISGITTACVGTTAVLYNGVTGGVWSSGATAIATIDPTTGIYTGIAPGTAVITYSMGSGCTVTATVTVSTGPAPITGTLNVCPGALTALANTTPGGTWSCSNPSIASIGAATGVVAGGSSGIATITYTVPIATGSCRVMAALTVDPAPAAITGTLTACPGTFTALGSATGGGTWTSGSPAIATVGSSTGVVNGITTGTTVITYTIPNGCSIAKTVTVHPNPTAIVGTSTICIGVSATLTNGTSGGTWSRSSSNVNVGSASGVITGVATGTTILTYRLPTGCFSTKTISVNTIPGTITGSLQLCIGAMSTLTSLTPGGTWSSSNPYVAAIGSVTGSISGITAGMATITYSIGTGCSATAAVTVSPAPTSFTVTGGGPYCTGGSGMHVGLSGSSSGVSYQLYMGATAVGMPLTSLGGSLDFGLLTAAGTYSVTATGAAGCTSGMSGSVSIIIIPLPVITGPSAVCAGSMITEASTLGGTWISSTPTVATIGSSSGVVSGIATGTATITYTLPLGCMAIRTITVSSGPGAITGTTAVCQTQNATLTTTTGGGFWSSSHPSIAPIGSSSGTVTGMTTGTATITYSMGAGCITTRLITVNTHPGTISGASALCGGGATTLSNTTPGGTWSSSALTIASVGLTTGLVNGITGGTATITYTLPTGCYATRMITVNSGPGSITGAASICQSLTSTLTSATGSGTWSSSSAGIATIGSSTGIVTGISPGTTIITYSLGTGCTTTRILTVYALPFPITGTTGTCVGTSVILSSGTTGGVWRSGNTAIAGVGSSSGIVIGSGIGTAIITYTNPTTGCATTTIVTVTSVPAAISGTNSVCVGSTATLTDATAGGIWSSSNPVVAAVGSATGTVSGLVVGGATITYSLGVGCAVTKFITVNPLPSSITGAANVCLGSSVALSTSSTGGAWSSATAFATINSVTGMVTGTAGGAAIISYTIPTGCAATYTLSVVAVPVIENVHSLCAWGDTIMIHNANPLGSYSSTLVTVTTISSGDGIVTAFSPGTGTITYTLTGLGCTATSVVTVNPLPNVINGTISICSASTTTLTNIAAGGTWSSSNTSVATIGSGSGLMSGMTGGVSTIVYTLPTGCKVDTLITVSTFPNAGTIAGAGMVCSGNSTTLTNVGSSASGVWSSSMPSVATVGSVTGVVYAVGAGIDTIKYLVANVCGTAKALHVLTVNQTPSPGVITGTDSVCVGAIVALADTAAGGVWNVSNANASISTSGIVSGLSVGIDTVYYTVTRDGCSAAAMLPVKVIPLSECNALSIAQYNTGNIWAYPSPNKGTFTVSGAFGSLAEGEEVCLQVTDMHSRVVYNAYTTVYNSRIEEIVQLDKIASGLYFVAVRSAKEYMVLRIVVER